MTEIRPLQLDEIPIIDSWYEQRGWPIIDKALLPFDGGKPSAYTLDDDGVLCYCCWIYTCNANFVVIDWIVSNPNKNTTFTLKDFIEDLITILKEKYDIKYILSLFDSNIALRKVFDRLGFKAGSDCTNYLKEL